MSKEPAKRSCYNCHFLMQWERPNGVEHKNFVGWEARSSLVDGASPSDVLSEGCSLACYCDVWDDANLREDEDRNISGRITANRAKSCRLNFHPYTPGTLFPAAVDLRNRDAVDRATSGGWGKRLAIWIPIILTLAAFAWGVWIYHNPSAAGR